MSEEQPNKPSRLDLEWEFHPDSFTEWAYFVLSFALGAFSTAALIVGVVRLVKWWAS